MAVTAGALSQISVTATTANLQSAPATAGTGPYTYQWHRSTTSGFTPSGATAISGATALVLFDSGLAPSTIYYYKVVATDTGASNATSTSSQLAVTTAQAAAGPSLNTMRLTKNIGSPRLLPQNNTVSVMLDTTVGTPLQVGQAVKIVDSAGGVPKVVACTANTDLCYGFINYDAKNSQWIAGQAVEISRKGNYTYLVATGPIARGAAVTLDTSVIGGVAQAVASSGANIVGEAFDKATAAGQIIGVELRTSSFAYA